MLFCGNDAAAGRPWPRSSRRLGGPPIDIGGIEGARLLEPMCILWVLYGIRRGLEPRLQAARGLKASPLSLRARKEPRRTHDREGPWDDSPVGVGGFGRRWIRGSPPASGWTDGIRAYTPPGWPDRRAQPYLARGRTHVMTRMWRRVPSTSGLARWVICVSIATVAGAALASCGEMSDPAVVAARQRRPPPRAALPGQRRSRDRECEPCHVKAEADGDIGPALKARQGDRVARAGGAPVKGRAPKTGYSREQFGDGWATVAGCDTRDRILRRDLTARRMRPATAARSRAGSSTTPTPRRRSCSSAAALRGRHRSRRRALGRVAEGRATVAGAVGAWRSPTIR